MSDWQSSFDDYYDIVETPPINDLLFGNDSIVDQHAQDLFMEAMFDGDDKAYQDLVDWMWDEYGIDFEEAFDWADFREWYDG